MPRCVNAWVALVVDTSLALDSAVQQDQRDPRVLGQGPCGRSHEQPLPLDLRENLPYLKWSSNQYGRRPDCQRCAVRLLYYPRQGQVGRCRHNESAAVVTRSIQEMNNRGETGCTHKLMKTYINLAEAEMKLRTSTGAKARAKVAPTPAPPPPPPFGTTTEMISGSMETVVMNGYHPPETTPTLGVQA